MKTSILLVSSFLFLMLVAVPAFGDSIQVNGPGGTVTSGILQGYHQIEYLTGSGNSSIPGDTFQFTAYLGSNNKPLGELTIFNATGGVVFICNLRDEHFLQYPLADFL